MNRDNKMNAQLKGFFDEMGFVKNPSSNLYESIVGDDIDSLVGCSYLKHVSGVEIGGYYDFDSAYLGRDRDMSKKLIGIDMSFIGEGKMCWDNHIQLGHRDAKFNESCASINTFHRNNAHTKSEYNQKYAGSTALQMFAYYDGKQPETVEGALLWISLDVGFKGHYDDRFKKAHNGYLEDLGLTWMIDVLDKYTKEEMYEFQNLHGLNSKVKMNAKTRKLYNIGKQMKDSDGNWKRGRFLRNNFIEEHLGFSVELPDTIFHKHKEYYRQSRKVSEINMNRLDMDNIVSLAYTYTGQIEFTTKKQKMYIQQ